MSAAGPKGRRQEQRDFHTAPGDFHMGHVLSHRTEQKEHKPPQEIQHRGHRGRAAAVVHMGIKVEGPAHSAAQGLKDPGEGGGKGHAGDDPGSRGHESREGKTDQQRRKPPEGCLPRRGTFLRSRPCAAVTTQEAAAPSIPEIEPQLPQEQYTEGGRGEHHRRRLKGKAQDRRRETFDLLAPQKEPQHIQLAQQRDEIGLRGDGHIPEGAHHGKTEDGLKAPAPAAGESRRHFPDQQQAEHIAPELKHQKQGKAAVAAEGSGEELQPLGIGVYSIHLAEGREEVAVKEHVLGTEAVAETVVVRRDVHPVQLNQQEGQRQEEILFLSVPGRRKIGHRRLPKRTKLSGNSSKSRTPASTALSRSQLSEKQQEQQKQNTGIKERCQKREQHLMQIQLPQQQQCGAAKKPPPADTGKTVQGKQQNAHDQQLSQGRLILPLQQPLQVPGKHVEKQEGKHGHTKDKQKEGPPGSAGLPPPHSSVFFNPLHRQYRPSCKNA